VAAFVEFAAVALELLHFAPRERPCYFPAIEDWRVVDEVLTLQFPHLQWQRETRPDGAPDVCPAMPHIPRRPMPPADAGAAALAEAEQSRRCSTGAWWMKSCR